MSLKKINLFLFLFILNNFLQASGHQNQRRWISSFFGSCMTRTTAVNTQIPLELYEEDNSSTEDNTAMAFITDAAYVDNVTVAVVENDELERLKVFNHALQFEIDELRAQVKALRNFNKQEKNRHVQTMMSRVHIKYERDCLRESLKIIQDTIDQQTEQLAIIEESAQELILSIEEKDIKTSRLERHNRILKKKTSKYKQFILANQKRYAQNIGKSRSEE